MRGTNRTMRRRMARLSRRKPEAAPVLDEAKQERHDEIVAAQRRVSILTAQVEFAARHTGSLDIIHELTSETEGLELDENEARLLTEGRLGSKERLVGLHAALAEALDDTLALSFPDDEASADDDDDEEPSIALVTK